MDNRPGVKFSVYLDAWLVDKLDELAVNKRVKFAK